MDEDDDKPIAQLIREYEENIPLAKLCAVTKRTVTLPEMMDADNTIYATEDATDETIVESLIPSDVSCLGDADDDDDDDDVISDEQTVSKTDAVEAIGKLRSYLESHEDISDTVFMKLFEIEKCIMNVKQKQKSILDFFK